MSVLRIASFLVSLSLIGGASSSSSEFEGPIDPQDWIGAKPAAVVYVPSVRRLVAKIRDNEVWSHPLIDSIPEALVDPAAPLFIRGSLDRSMINAFADLVESLAIGRDTEVYLFVEAGAPLVKSWTLAVSCDTVPQQEFEYAIEAAERLVGRFVTIESSDGRQGRLLAGEEVTPAFEWIQSRGWLWVYPPGGPGEATAKRLEANQPPAQALAESRRWINAKVDHSSRPDGDLYAYVDPSAIRPFMLPIPSPIWQVSGLGDLISMSIAVEFESDETQSLVEVDLFARVAVPRRGVWQMLSGSGRIDRVRELPDKIRSAQYFAFDSEKLGEQLRDTIAATGRNPIVDGMNAELARMGNFTVEYLLEAFDGQVTIVGTGVNEGNSGDFWMLVSVADRQKAETFARAYARNVFHGRQVEPNRNGESLEWFVENPATRQPTMGLVLTHEYLLLGTESRSAEVGEARDVPLAQSHPQIRNYLEALRSANEGKLPFMSCHFLAAELELQLVSWIRDAEFRRQRLLGPKVDLADFKHELMSLSQYPRPEQFLEQCLLRILVAGKSQIEAAAIEAYDETTGFRLTAGLYRVRPQ